MDSGVPSDGTGAGELEIQRALRICIQQAPLPFAIIRGPDHSLVYANSAFCDLEGFSEADSLGAPIAKGFSAPDAEMISALLDRALNTYSNVLDERIERLNENGKDWNCSVWPVIDATGSVEAAGIEIRELFPGNESPDLQRQVAEQMLLGALRERGFAEDAEAARRRAAFLAEAGRLLAQTVDQASTLLALTKLALPAIGAWCIVDILKEAGAIHRLGIFHPDREKQRLALNLEPTWLPERDDPFGAPAMLRKAKSIAITSNIEVTLAATAHSAENLRTLRQLGIGSLLTVPLIARNQLLGAITFVSASRATSFSPEDIQLAEDLADRGALALDNAQVYDLALVLMRNADSANKAKTAFLGAMSHELRTPLNAIGGYIELLDMGLRGPVTDRQRNDFARVKTNQRHLTLLVTEILNFARVGSGLISYASANIPAGETLKHAFELIEPLVGQKGIVFDGIKCEPGSIAALADPERVAQILVNLFSNAIKFTSAGDHIGAECTANGETVTLTISDTGIGIPPDKLDSIFEPFVQIKESLSNREGGVGLGLAISRDLARAMKGDLTVESTEGKGSRFSLSLPRNKSEA